MVDNEDKTLKYWIDDNYGSFDNPCRQSHYGTQGLCGVQFDLRYNYSFDSEIRRLNTEIGTFDHEGFDCYHRYGYRNPSSVIDYVISDIVNHRDNKNNETQNKRDESKARYGNELWRRLIDPEKAPVKQVVDSPEKTRMKAEEDGFEMLETYCYFNKEDSVLVIDGEVFSEIDMKVEIDGIWYEGTIDQIRVTDETLERIGNRFTWDEFCKARDDGSLDIEIVDAKTGIMVPGTYGLLNSIQTKLYSTGIHSGTVLIAGEGRVLDLWPSAGYIYHTRKLMRYKKKYTHPTKKDADGNKMVFQAGDMKGDPKIYVFRSQQEMIDSIPRFKRMMRSYFDSIKKGVYVPNLFVCDSFCDVPKACVEFNGKIFEDGIIDDAQRMAKELNF